MLYGIDSEWLLCKLKGYCDILYLQVIIFAKGFLTEIAVVVSSVRSFPNKPRCFFLPSCYEGALAVWAQFQSPSV